jgi:hypothetical protein
MENIDVFRVVLDSESADLGTESLGNYIFNVKLGTRRTDYKKYILYVDNFSISLKGLTTHSVLVKLNIGQYNSYSSLTEGNNQVIATVFNPNVASGRTVDLALNYQAPNTPYRISTLPDDFNVNLTDIDNTAINMSSTDNFWLLSLRIEAFYD